MAPETPVGPWQATVRGVLDLVPEASLLSEGATVPPVSGEWVSAAAAPQRGVTLAAVTGWLEQLSARVAMRLDGWQQLPAEPVAPETTSDRDQLSGYARDLVHNGAASYLEAARHPERAALSQTTYDQVLWARFTGGLDQLDEWLRKRLAAGAPVEGGGSASAAAGNFPPPTFLDVRAY